MITLTIDIIEEKEENINKIKINSVNVDITKTKCRSTESEEKLCKLIENKLKTDGKQVKQNEIENDLENLKLNKKDMKSLIDLFFGGI